MAVALVPAPAPSKLVRLAKFAATESAQPVALPTAPEKPVAVMAVVALVAPALPGKPATMELVFLLVPINVPFPENNALRITKVLKHAQILTAMAARN